MSIQLRRDKPTIKILMYTDDPRITQSANIDEFFGLGSMIDRLKAHAPAFAKLDTKWVCRNPEGGNHADNKINVVLQRELETTKEPFDQIWFFGLHQTNTAMFSLGVVRGGPQSELDEAEVVALQDWMRVKDGFGGGGVLITGDHSEERPAGAVVGTNPLFPDNSANEAYLGLGRAIGRCVPRAGLLRKWEGDPTYREIDSFNTLAGPGFQTDPVPQRLILTKFNAAGEPDPNGQPHPLFLYQSDLFIDVFPDHAHEGAVVIPEEFDENVWPTGTTGRPRPCVVARGTDQRNSKLLNIVATYDGDPANVGRIVADSTWHHYMNLNLTSFPHPARPGSVSDQIGQFYANLAVWLAPRSKRVEMGRVMCWRLADYTLLLEPRRDPLSRGKTADAILSRVASACEIQEIIRALTPEQFGAPNFSERIQAHGDPTLRESILGFILDSYHQEMIRSENLGTLKSNLIETLRVENVINTGFSRAYKNQADQLQRSLDALKVVRTNND